MFIQTESTPNPANLKFLPDREVLASGTADFASREAALHSPLAKRLFEVEGVTAVFFGPDYITVTKMAGADWQVLKPAVLGAIMAHYVSGEPVVVDTPAPEPRISDDQNDRLAMQIQELIDTRIRPAAAQSGGDVFFRSFTDGIVFLEMSGGAPAMKDGIENMLRHYVPEVMAVKDYRDAIPKPGLNTPEGKAIQLLLDQTINPGVAAHGGHISLVDVQDDTAYIRLEGGCQGCGMADVTLKQGVESEIKRVAPAIATVLDATDHAGGENPYYQPGKEGMSPF